MENGRLGVDESVAVLSVKTGFQLEQFGCTGRIIHAEVDLTNRTEPIVDVVAEDKSRVQGDVIPSRGNDVCPFSHVARVGKESAAATAAVGDCGLIDVPAVSVDAQRIDWQPTESEHATGAQSL